MRRTFLVRSARRKRACGLPWLVTNACSHGDLVAVRMRGPTAIALEFANVVLVVRMVLDPIEALAELVEQVQSRFPIVREVLNGLDSGVRGRHGRQVPR